MPVPGDLAAALLQEGLPAEAIDRAVRQQRAVGGALDSALLELEVVDEPALVAAMVRAAGLPPPPPWALADPDPRVRRLFPANLAEQHGVAPFRLEGGDLTVLATWPVDVAALDEVGAVLSLRVLPHVAPEWRVRELSYRVYGRPPGERFERLAARAREREAAEDPLAFDIDVVFELPPSPELDVDDRPPGWTLDDARGALAAAASRDDVVRTALRYCRESFEVAAFFAVGKERIFGHDALGVPAARERCRRFSRPAADAGAVGAAARCGGPQLRRIEPADPLLAALERAVPHRGVLAPILLRGKIAAVLYADNGDAPVSASRVRDLLIFTAALGPAFERIVRSRKAAGGAAAPLRR